MTHPDDSPAIGGKGQDDSPGLPRLWAERRKREPLIISTPHERQRWFIDAMGGALGTVAVAFTEAVEAAQEVERSMAMLSALMPDDETED